MCRTLERLKEIGGINRGAKCPFEKVCGNSKTEEHSDGCQLVDTLEVIDCANKIVAGADLNYFTL